MGAIRKYSVDELGYKNLKVVADKLTEASKAGTKYEVRDVYFDFGQDWWWTTVVAERETVRLDSPYTSTWQVLYPTVHGKIVIAESETELDALVEKVKEVNKNLDEY